MFSLSFLFFILFYFLFIMKMLPCRCRVMRACLETHEFRSGLWHARNVQHAYFYAKETEKKYNRRRDAEHLLLQIIAMYRN